MHLYSCIKEAEMFRGMSVHAAFEWTSANYERKIVSIFPNVTALRVSPFHGMTDILIRHSLHVGVIKVDSYGAIEFPKMSVCCVEVGTGKPSIYTLP